MTEDEDDGGWTRSGPKLVIEDFGAPPADDDLAGVPDNISDQKHRLQLPPAKVMRLLARSAEREMAGQVGRPREMHKEMQRVAAVFGAVLDSAAQPLTVKHHDKRAPGSTIHQDILLQQ